MIFNLPEPMPCWSIYCQCDKCKARMAVWLEYAKEVCPTYPDGWTEGMGEKVYQTMKLKGLT